MYVRMYLRTYEIVNILIEMYECTHIHMWLTRPQLTCGSNLTTIEQAIPADIGPGGMNLYIRMYEKRKHVHTDTVLPACTYIHLHNISEHNIWMDVHTHG